MLSKCFSHTVNQKLELEALKRLIRTDDLSARQFLINTKVVTLTYPPHTLALGYTHFILAPKVETDLKFKHSANIKQIKVSGGRR